MIPTRRLDGVVVYAALDAGEVDLLRLNAEHHEVIVMRDLHFGKGIEDRSNGCDIFHRHRRWR